MYYYEILQLIETTSYLYVSMQRYTRERIIWVMDKTNISSGSASMVKALTIKESSDEFIVNPFWLKVHSFFGLLIGGASKESAYGATGYAGYMIDWNVAGD